MAIFGKSKSADSASARIERLEESVEAKDHSIQDLQETNRLLTEQLKLSNTTLMDQLKFRWTSYQALTAGIPTVLSAFFTFGLASAFLYQVYKAEEARGLADTIRDQRNHMNSQAAIQSSIIGKLTQVVTQLDAAEREFNNGRYSRTVVEAEAARVVMDDANQTLDSERANVRRLAASQKAGTESTVVDLVTPLQASVDELRASCYVLAAQAHFSQFAITENRADLGEVRRIGKILQASYPHRWQGFHFVGIGSSEDGNYEAAVAPLEQAVRIMEDQKLPVQLDLQNLAETYFMLGKYDKSELRAKAYFESDPNAVGDVKVVNAFFLDVSQFMQSGDPAMIARFRTTLEEVIYPLKQRDASFKPSSTINELAAKAVASDKQISSVYSTTALRGFYHKLTDKYELQALQKTIPELADPRRRSTMIDTLHGFITVLKYKKS